MQFLDIASHSIHLPEKWSFESKVEWHYDRLEVPLIYSSHAENPDNAEACFQYPLLRAEIIDVAPRYSRYAPKTSPVIACLWAPSGPPLSLPCRLWRRA